MITLHAIAGPAPMPITSANLGHLESWIEETTDHYRQLGKAPTAAALINLAYHATKPGIPPEKIAQKLHNQLKEKLEHERQYTLALIRGQRPAEAAPAEEGTDTQPRQKDAPEEAPKATKARFKLWGFSMGEVLRWMGKKGWDADKANKVLAAFECYPAPDTVRWQLIAGTREGYGEPAAFTSDQIKKLNAAAKK